MDIKFVCFNNLYEKCHVIQFRVYKFVLIYNCQTKQNKTLSEKKGLPLEPRYVGMCTFSTKRFETQIHLNSFLYQKPQDNQPENETYMNSVSCHIVKPFLLRGYADMHIKFKVHLVTGKRNE